MANFTAADVKRLRELTGAGMLDCKNALAESDGDFDKAVEALRLKGAKDVGKPRARRTAGGPGHRQARRHDAGVLIELNSETDFVAKNAEFQKVAEEIASVALEHRPTDRLALSTWRSAGRTVEQVIAEVAPRSGRSSNCAGSHTSTGTVETYLHKPSRPLPRVCWSSYTSRRSDRQGRGAADRRAGRAVPDSGRCARGGRGQRTAHRRGDLTRRGQAGAGAAQDRRRPPGRVLQRRRAARAAVSVRTARRRSRRCSTKHGVTVRAFVRFEVGQAG